MHCTALAPLLLAASALAQDKIELTEDLYPGAVDPSGRDWIVARVVDDLTGEPIAGAEVFLVKEADTPIAGEFWSTKSAKTDADGWLRVQVADVRGKWHIQVLKTAGHAIATQSGRGELVWRVGRPFDVPVLVRDWQHRPVAHARIGFCGGCGHTPDLVNATTGADGVAVLSGIDPQNSIRDVYVQHPGLGLGYDSIRWLPGAPPWEIECAWAPAKTGKLVDHAGNPVAGAFVGANDVHRGPWAKTAADGSFTVLGAPPNVGVATAVLADGKKVFFDDPPGYPATLKLPSPTSPDPEEGTVSAAAGVEPQPPSTRSVRVRVDGAPSPHVSIAAKYPLASANADGDRNAVQVPTTGPFVLVAEDVDAPSDSRRWFAYDDAKKLGDEVVLQWQPDVRVTGRAVDEQQRPIAIGVRWRNSWSGGDDRGEPDLVACKDGRFALPRGSAGLALLELVPAAPGALPRGVWVTVPVRGKQAEVALGDVVLRAAAPLYVLDESGQPAASAEVGFARAGYQEPGQLFTWPLTADGGWQGPDLRAGDAVVVRADGESLPFRTVLAGDGPWTITVPGGELLLQVVDGEGDDVGATAVFGDQVVELRADRPLRGLPRGPFRCYVGALGHKSAIVTTLVAKEPRTLRVELPAR